MAGSVAAAVYLVCAVLIVGGMAGNGGRLSGRRWGLVFLACFVSGVALAIISLA